jgi:hypothetical protein
MGEYNSSVTRVWPVFDWLFHNDLSGPTWLRPLLKMGSRATEVDQQIMNSNPGTLLAPLADFARALPGPLRKVLGPRAKQLPSIRGAYEVDIPPSAAFLRWLLERPERLTWPKGNLHLSPPTFDKRSRLLAGEADVRDKALNELEKSGAVKSRRKWWAFEGFTSVDCWIETDSLLLLIEGKRTDALSASTAWFPARNQVARILEGAKIMAAARRKNFAVLVCAEALIADLEDEVWASSLPHLSDIKIGNLTADSGQIDT